jgi:N-acetylmuramoyl-L-alanine amidase
MMVVVLALWLVAVLCGTVLAAAYPVRPGDSLFKIARRFGSTVEELKRNNGLKGDTIHPKQVIQVPDGRVSTHRVKSGESLYLISRSSGMSVSQLRTANDVSGDYIESGWLLVLSSTAGGRQLYTVQRGDSLFLIARRFGTTVEELRRANGIKGDCLKAGRTIQVPAEGAGSEPSQPSQGAFSASDIEILARLVHAEAGGEPYEGQVAVAASVLNRVKDPRYPNTIPGVVYEVTDGRYYQYSPVLDGRINLPASQAAFSAVREAIGGRDPSLGANGFYNPAKTTNRWVRSHPVTTVIGNHVFFRY